MKNCVYRSIGVLFLLYCSSNLGLGGLTEFDFFNAELPNEQEFVESGKNLYRLRSGMNSEQVLETLGFGKYLKSNQVISKTQSGTGVGGFRTEYFGHLKGYELTITSSLNKELVLNWKTPSSALITVFLGKTGIERETGHDENKSEPKDRENGDQTKVPGTESNNKKQ